MKKTPFCIIKTLLKLDKCEIEITTPTIVITSIFSPSDQFSETLLTLKQFESIEKGKPIEQRCEVTTSEVTINERYIMKEIK